MSPKPPENLTQTLAALQSAGLARLDAQLLLLHVLGQAPTQRGWLLAHDTDLLSPAQLEALTQLAQRRLSGEPLAYITGHKEFFGLDLQVDARVLVPRPDTETLVNWALEVLTAAAEFPPRPDVSQKDVPEHQPPPKGGRLEWRLPVEPHQFEPHHPRLSDNGCDTGGKLSVLDLGTGSGAIALALKASQPALQVHALDFSLDALAVAQANARRLQLDVTFSQGAWLAGLTDPSVTFECIVSNPPYIAAQDAHLAALTHEPLQALTSGTDGLDDIRQIIAQAPTHLKPDGWLLLEHGFDQAHAVRDLLTTAGFTHVQSRQDLAGIERCSGGQHP